MKSKLIVIVSAFCLLAGGVFYMQLNKITSAETTRATAADNLIIPKPELLEIGNRSRVTQIDLAGFQTLIKRGGTPTKPLLVNFWATWCIPCRVEFPELVKIDNDYKGKMDFITVSFDELSEIETGVPDFLAKMNAKMPGYLMKTTDEEAAIKAIFKDWQGGLPFTILYNEKGEIIFTQQGLIKPVAVRAEIEKSLAK